MFKIEFRTDRFNAFPHNGDTAEASASILDKIAAKIREGVTNGAVYDDNGNKLGAWSLDHTDD